MQELNLNLHGLAPDVLQLKLYLNQPLNCQMRQKGVTFTSALVKDMRRQTDYILRPDKDATLNLSAFQVEPEMLQLGRRHHLRAGPAGACPAS